MKWRREGRRWEEGGAVRRPAGSNNSSAREVVLQNAEVWLQAGGPRTVVAGCRRRQKVRRGSNGRSRQVSGGERDGIRTSELVVWLWQSVAQLSVAQPSCRGRTEVTTLPPVIGGMVSVVHEPERHSGATPLSTSIELPRPRVQEPNRPWRRCARHDKSENNGRDGGAQAQGRRSGAR